MNAMAPSADARRLASALRQRLLAAASPDGGWGYYTGRASRLEPTAWALLALTPGAAGTSAAAISRARTFLAGLQRSSGFLVEGSIPEANVGWNGLALVARGGGMTQTEREAHARLASAILSAKGVSLDGDQSAIRQNTHLQAWSWVDGTFSWVEPTGWCLLAAKRFLRTHALAPVRIKDAEAVLTDRVCEPGGWNYGNSNAFTQDLRPYVPTTALGLLAMQDRRGDPAVKESLAWLEANASSERSAMALSLAAIALHVYGRTTDAVMEALVEEEARTKFLDNALLVGMAHVALTLGDHDGAAFRIKEAA